ncbi:hypothetical protein [Listeria booriae]|uniref:hypothetical protein n=1 Tax=Listeria booriae TaxID=1552123 RepID=UPI0016282D45|nr:hypothetical protein [Listeria booriae]MBC1247335.1 hypothetical protein [Listeria booriae]
MNKTNRLEQIVRWLYPNKSPEVTLLDKIQLGVASGVVYFGVSMFLMTVITYLGDKGYIELVVGKEEHMMLILFIISLFIIMFGVILKIAIHTDVTMSVKYTRLSMKLAFYIILLTIINYLIGLTEYKDVDYWLLGIMLACFSRELFLYMNYGWRKLNASVKDGKDKMAILIAIFGTIISLVAIFK